MTNHPNRSKKTIAVHLRSRDCKELALMLRLHADYCRQRARECFDAVPLGAGKGHPEYDRTNKAIASWNRACRKANAMAAEFETARVDLINGF